MKNLFSPENPVIQFLSRVGEMMIANALFLLCSLPVLTGGAALTALNRVMQDIALGEDAGAVKPFFRAFRDNFRQATVGWLMLLVFLAGMGGNLLLALSYLTGNALLVCKWVLGALTLWILSAGCWYFQLLARYDNTVRQHLANGAILTAVKLPRSLGLAALALLPALIAYASMQVFLSTLVYWLMLGFMADYTAYTDIFEEVSGIYEKYYSALITGTVDPEIYVSRMNRELSDAGLDLLQQELQRQIDHWLAAHPASGALSDLDG